MQAFETLNMSNFLAPNSQWLSSIEIDQLEWTLISQTGQAVPQNLAAIYLDNIVFSTGASQVTVSNTIVPAQVSNNVSSYDIEQVRPDRIYFLESGGANRSIFSKGSSDPNFTGVYIPESAGQEYLLEFIGANGSETQLLLPGERFLFGDTGVDSFSLSEAGTESFAVATELADQADASLTNDFVAGITLASTGSFTGSVTAVPEPPVYGMFLVGLVGFVALHRRRQISGRFRIERQGDPAVDYRG
jgi:hypothetical protein